MEVRPRNRQTEVGVFPEEWEVKPLKRISPKQGVGLVINPSTYFDKAGTVPLLVGSNVSENLIDATHANRITTSSNDLLSASRLAAGDLVTVRVGEPGVTAVVPPELDGCNCASMMIVRRHSSFDSHWLCAVMNSSLGRRQVEHVQYGTAQKQFNISDAVNFQFAVPPLPEQRAIAAALSDVDALLGGLDRLIAKKRDLKRAAMQQLLTGQTRLPGFHGEWEVKSLDMITSRATGVWGSNEPDERNCHRVEIIRAGDISQDGRLTATATRYVSAVEFEKAKCGLDDLVITTSGNGLGKLWWCDERSEIAASNFVRVLHPISAKVTGRFLYYELRTGEGLRQLQEHTATSAYPNLRPSYFSTAWIPLPPPSEQTAIAGALSDMDAELAAIEARRDKTRALKQGMMQELLTGRTRLVERGTRVEAIGRSEPR